MTALWITLGVVVLLLLIGVVMYNRFVSQRQSIKDAFANIDTELRRRYDLIPNLVETVKGYASHEREAFERVTAARTAAMQAQGPAETSQAEGMLSQALGGLRVVAEQYPDLRATENFQQLSRNLSELEDEIQASRRIYNSNVQDYNTKIQQFPMSIVANQGGFASREFFEVAEASDREVPEVSFSQTPPAAS